MAVTALQAAKLACSASDWTLSNLQLQKILYIAHMLYSGHHCGEPLIEGEEFEAWDYGPVLPTVYRTASAFGTYPIRNVFHGVPGVSPERDEHRSIVDAVGKMASASPFRLVKITHEPVSAWYANYRPGVKGVHIPQGDIVAEFNKRFDNDQRRSHGERTPQQSVTA